MALGDFFDAFDWIYWMVAQQNPMTYVWLENNLEFHAVLQLGGTHLLGNAETPID